jgi:ankyrin repeat protein
VVCLLCDKQIEAIPLVNRTKLDPNVQDANGKTALHYVVNPLDFGSYENVQMLLTLAKAGADVNVKDKQGACSLSLSPVRRQRTPR